MVVIFQPRAERTRTPNLPLPARVRVIFSIVLMLNLLIAKMSDTYSVAYGEGTLRWRYEFARLVLRLEMMLPLQGVNTHAG